MTTKIPGVCCQKCRSEDLEFTPRMDRDSTIVEMAGKGISQADIAVAFKMTRQRVGQIVKRSVEDQKSILSY